MKRVGLEMKYWDEMLELYEKYEVKDTRGELEKLHKQVREGYPFGVEIGDDGLPKMWLTECPRNCPVHLHLM